jgi:hypothetical protein
MTPNQIPSHSAIRGSTAILAVATIGFSAAVRGSASANTIFIIPAIGLLLIASMRSVGVLEDATWRRDRFNSLIWFLVAVTTATAFLDVRLPDSEGASPTSLWYWFASAWLALALFGWLTTNLRPAHLSKFVWLVMAVSLLEMIFVIALDPEPGIDVYELHTSAAHNLGSAQSPYRNLGVENTSPFAGSDQTIDGYPYPPAALLPFAVGSWLGDPRIAPSLAWLGLIGLLFRRVARARQPDAAGVGLSILMASQPGWIFVIDQSWTEPLTLALIGAAALSWQTRPLASAALLGLAIASKQYMVLLLPAALFVLFAEQKRSRILAWMLGSAGMISAPFLLMDAPGVWSSTIEFHLSTPPRSDSSNLVGLLRQFDIDWALPGWFGLIVAALVAYLIVLRQRNLAGFALASAVGLSLFFFLASQAFANYWLLVVGVTIVATLVSVPPATAALPDD